MIKNDALHHFLQINDPYLDPDPGEGSEGYEALDGVGRWKPQTALQEEGVIQQRLLRLDLKICKNPSHLGLKACKDYPSFPGDM